jgi:hypothetical protein
LLAGTNREKIGAMEDQRIAYTESPLFKGVRKSIEFHRSYEKACGVRFMKVEQFPKRLVV